MNISHHHCVGNNSRVVPTSFASPYKTLARTTSRNASSSCESPQKPHSQKSTKYKTKAKTESKAARFISISHDYNIQSSSESFTSRTITVLISFLKLGKELMQDIWTKDHQVINVHDIPDEELKKKAWAGILQFFMKHIHERDLLKRWYEVADLLPELAKLNIGIDYLELILTYTLIKIEKSDKIELEKILKSRLNNQQGEKLMTSLAHHWKEEGIQQGMQIGRNEGMQIGEARGMQIGEAKRTMEVAKNMLSNNYSIPEVSRITGLSISELNTINLTNKKDS
ncbi:Rpn family recombination-promoting nuclease/putative transposase (plasmid) [Rickettsia helvetica]|uniref:Rpn family recombination-promoting nuclease/putative transposase n=1 Tax=Rickettsia helvetica TaxID=35789 RepID=UPI0033BEB1D9